MTKEYLIPTESECFDAIEKLGKHWRYDWDSLAEPGQNPLPKVTHSLLRGEVARSAIMGSLIAAVMAFYKQHNGLGEDQITKINTEFGFVLKTLSRAYLFEDNKYNGYEF